LLQIIYRSESREALPQPLVLKSGGADVHSSASPLLSTQKTREDFELTRYRK